MWAQPGLCRRVQAAERGARSLRLAATAVPAIRASSGATAPVFPGQTSLRPSCRSLLPVNYTSYVPDPALTTTDSNGTTVNDAFLRMTMSAIPTGSSVLWWAAPAHAGTTHVACRPRAGSKRRACGSQADM